MYEQLLEEVRSFICDKMREIQGDTTSYDELQESLNQRDWQIYIALNRAENELCI